MLERSKELYKLLDEGASFYVCGHTAMGRGVQQAMISIIQKEGNVTKEKAGQILREATETRRYQADVFE